MKIAIISPYYKESPEMIERCMISVQRQSIKCDHFLISDGFPQSWIDETDVRHICLGKSHADYGNTPRGIGAQIAISENHDAIGFLDADNTYDLNHIEVCIQSVFAKYDDIQACDYVIAKRRLVRPYGTTLVESPKESFVDTNCYLFLRGSFHTIPVWNLMPKPLSLIGDRIFGMYINNQKLNSAVNPKSTINYLTLLKSIYLAAGENPPNDCKPGIGNDTRLLTWLAHMSDHDRKITQNILKFAPSI